jgi:spermidine synthase
VEAEHGKTKIILDSATWIVRRRGESEIHAVQRQADPLVSFQSPYQFIEIVSTHKFGRALVLDGVYQSSDYDEHLKHESLVHPVLVTLRDREVDVLIIGGGEGCVAREVLRHPNVRSVHMIELDQNVTKLCAEYLKWDEGALKDERVQLHFGNAALILPKFDSSTQFDVVIVDSTQPVEGSAAADLLSDIFLQQIQHRLREGGHIVGYGVNAGPVGMDIRVRIRNALLSSLAGTLTEYVVPCPFYSALFAYQIWSASEYGVRTRVINDFWNCSFASDLVIDMDSIVSYFHIPWGYRAIG